MLKFCKNYYLVFLSALILSLSRLPLYLGWAVLSAFFPLLLWINKRKRKAGELIVAALIFCLVQIVLVFYWIGSVTWPGLVGIWLLFTLYYWVVFLGLNRIWHHAPKLRYIGFVSLFISFEFLQNFGEMRFPWWNIGYSLADFELLLQALDIGGLSFLALLILSFNYLFWMISQARSRKARISLIGVIAVLLLIWQGYGAHRLIKLPMIQKADKIAVMQPSIPQVEKWDEEQYRNIIAVYDSLSAEAVKQGADLLIYPEASIPDYIMLNPSSMADVQKICQKHDLNIFCGFPHAERAPESHPEPFYYYNAASLIDSGGEVAPLYFKNILVPVGERMLWLDYFPFLWKLQFGQANWEFGKTIPRYSLNGNSFAPSICYELAFPNFMMKSNLKSEDDSFVKADYHVNLTNDAWFGTSYGPWLHGVMTKYRAIESRVQTYRSANTGISMIVDPGGRVLSKSPLFAIENISAPLYVCPIIPLYARIPNYPFIFVLISIICIIISLTRREKSHE